MRTSLNILIALCILLIPACGSLSIQAPNFEGTDVSWAVDDQTGAHDVSVEVYGNVPIDKFEIGWCAMTEVSHSDEGTHATFCIEIDAGVRACINIPSGDFWTSAAEGCGDPEELVPEIEWDDELEGSGEQPPEL